ncbi:MAG TPA: hypothetical protein VG123_02120 [Streptosporangiaceae bacterium]|nr:hypothetical protein [Streptosporangiaceae bacterium]
MHPELPEVSDPVLAALADARRRRDQAVHDIRILLACARELTRPRPYRLADLAAAAGLSISGVRVGYTRQHVDRARCLLLAAGAQRPVNGAEPGGSR